MTLKSYERNVTKWKFEKFGWGLKPTNQTKTQSLLKTEIPKPQHDITNATLSLHNLSSFFFPTPFPFHSVRFQIDKQKCFSNSNTGFPFPFPFPFLLLLLLQSPYHSQNPISPNPNPQFHIPKFNARPWIQNHCRPWVPTRGGTPKSRSRHGWSRELRRETSTKKWRNPSPDCNLTPFVKKLSALILGNAGMAEAMASPPPPSCF